MTRVVITGMAGISPIGHDATTRLARLRDRQSAIRYIDAWDCYSELQTRLGAPVVDFETPAHYPRKALRSMGRVAVMAVRATEMALDMAGLLDDPILGSGLAGVAFGSSAGDTDSVASFAKMLLSQSYEAINANSYIKMMAHTAPVNIGVHFGLKGRVITTSSACTSGSQGIGYAFEAIRQSKQDIMVAGGSEALCATQAAVFDTLFATSTRNDAPHTSPRPFDADRDGLVIGEGAGTLILESLDHAQARGATILAEIVGFGTNSDGRHVTHPEAKTMEIAMRLALDDARLNPADIDYISAHATATERGDIAESHATNALFSDACPISALKSYSGHTLGACGALEAITSLEMMQAGWFHPILNLDTLDARCAELDYITGEGRRLDCEHVMSNNFAFGGINTSLIFKRWA